MNDHDRDYSKDWEERLLKDFQIKQDELNRLIMDYLVNGAIFFFGPQNLIALF